MRFVVLAVTATLLGSAPDARADLLDECRHSAARKVATQAAGVEKVVIRARAGSLTVTGAPGAGRIVAAGKACTSDRDYLEEMNLTMRRSGTELRIEAVMPEKTVFGFFSATLDFAVTIPAGVAVVIEDGSGWMKLSGTGPATIEDGSGSIEVRGVRGALTITDGSGSIDAQGVAGPVMIDDGSGDISLSRVEGHIELEDGSGSIVVSDAASVRVRDDGSGSVSIQGVKGNVAVDDDGSGTLEVRDVGGSFSVGHKSSGSIDYTRVAGKVSVPRIR